MSIREELSIPPELAVIVERYAVYRCYGDDGQLLYVGETGDLGTRLAAHAQKLWFTQVRGITLEWYADELDALNAERRAIHVEHPKYNVVHRSSPTLRRPAPARRQRRKAPQRPDRTPEETRKLAASILADEPGITGRELGERCGRGERWGQLRKSELAGHVADGGSQAQGDGG